MGQKENLFQPPEYAAEMFSEYFEIQKARAVRASEIEAILGDDYDLDRLQDLVKADREGRVKILAPAMLATCGSCTSFQRTPGTASGICEKREQFKVFQKRPCCKMYEARED